jgi:hypothetical protein
MQRKYKIANRLPCLTLRSMLLGFALAYPCPIRRVDSLLEAETLSLT